MKISYLTQEFDVQPTRTVRVRPAPQLLCFYMDSTLFHPSLSMASTWEAHVYMQLASAVYLAAKAEPTRR